MMVICYVVSMLLCTTIPLYSFTGKSFLTSRSQGSYYNHKNFDYNTLQ